MSLRRKAEPTAAVGTAFAGRQRQRFALVTHHCIVSKCIKGKRTATPPGQPSLQDTPSGKSHMS